MMSIQLTMQKRRFTQKVDMLIGHLGYQLTHQEWEQHLQQQMLKTKERMVFV